MLDLDAPPSLSLAEISMPSAPSEMLVTTDEHKDLTGYLTLRQYREGWLIADVFVLREHRGKGLASELLDQAILAADEFDIDLVLRVAGNGQPDTLDDEQLGEWYRRYGFDTHPEWNIPSVLLRRSGG